MRRPRMSPVRAAAKSGTARADEVESIGVGAGSADSASAASPTVARTDRSDPATRRTPPGHSATRARTSASARRRRRTTPAGGSSRRCRSECERHALRGHRAAEPPLEPPGVRSIPRDCASGRRPSSRSRIPSRTRPVGLADDDGAGRFEPLDDGRVVGGTKLSRILERQSCACRCAQVVLQRDGSRSSGPSARQTRADGRPGRRDRARDPPPSG